MPSEQVKQISSFIFQKKGSKAEDLFLIVGSEGTSSWITQVKSLAIYKTTLLTSGTNPRIGLQENGNIVVVLENSYCHSGLLLNNNAENKCVLHESDVLRRFSALPGLVNLMEASIPGMKLFIDREATKQIVTACHPSIRFSKLLNGANVNVLSLWGSILVSTKYIPEVDQDFMTGVFSGGSNYDLSLNNATGAYVVAVRTGGLPSAQPLPEE